MAKFTPEQWHQALCDVHMHRTYKSHPATIWWNGLRFEIGTAVSNYGKLVWTMHGSPRPTYEQALAIVESAS